MNDDDRKAPPQASLPEEDSKPAAAATPVDNPSKKRKTNEGKAASPPRQEIVDVASELNFQPGDKIEVKWTINDEEDEEEENNKESEAKPKSDEGDESDGKSITVWWGAALCGKTERMHTLTEEERQESEGASELYKSSVVRLPIYSLNYSPLEEYGFDSHSMEEVAFISKQTLLNLSTDEIMLFRKQGEQSPPSSPTPDNEVAKDTSAVSKEFAGQEEVGAFMNQLMQQCLKSTGMDKKMKSLPASAQLAMAERIQKAKQGMLDKMMEETDKMGVGNKVITADVVRKCMSQMDGGK